MNKDKYIGTFEYSAREQYAIKTWLNYYKLVNNIPTYDKNVDKAYRDAKYHLRECGYDEEEIRRAKKNALDMIEIKRKERV